MRVRYSDLSFRTTIALRQSVFFIRSNRPLSPPSTFKDLFLQIDSRLAGIALRETIALPVSLRGLSQACGLPSLSSTPLNRSSYVVSDKSAFFRVWRFTLHNSLFSILIYVSLADSKRG